MAEVPVNTLPTQSSTVAAEPQQVSQATPGAFGADVGQATQNAGQMLDKVGDELFASQMRITNREDAIERVRDYGQFQKDAQDKLVKLSTEGDMSRQDTVNSYREFVDQRKNEILNGHRGSGESRARLAQKLEEDRISLIGDAAVMSVKAQQDMMSRAVNGGMNALSAKAFQNPADVPRLFQQLDTQLSDIAPGLSPQDEAKFRDAGKAKIAGSAIESFVARGDFDGAERILSMPGVSETIGSDAQTNMRRTILDARLKLRDASMAGIVQANKDRSYLRNMLGREPTDAEVNLVAGVTPKEGQSGGMFGSGLTGRVLSIITEGAPLFAQSMLSPQQEQVFQSALTQYLQPTMAPNPDTGVIEYRRPELPPFVAEALRRRGMPVPASARHVNDAQNPPSTLGEPVGTTEHGEPIYEAPNDATAMKMMQEVNRNGQRAVVRVADASERPKIWDMASKVAGPIAAGADLLSRTPVIGDMKQFPEFTQAQRYVPLLVNDLVKVLQNNPRFSEGERNQIRKEIELEPKAFDTPASFRNRIIGVDDALALREKNAYETARSTEVSLEERRHAMNVFNGIVRFRDALGVPPLARTPEEAKKLGTGATFRDPKGNVRKVP